jgi:hypothetical protein
MKNSVKDVSEEFLPKGQAMGFMVKRRHFRADNDFPMGEGENIGGGGVGKVGGVQVAAFAG